LGRADGWPTSGSGAAQLYRIAPQKSNRRRNAAGASGPDAVKHQAAFDVAWMRRRRCRRRAFEQRIGTASRPAGTGLARTRHAEGERPMILTRRHVDAAALAHVPQPAPDVVPTPPTPRPGPAEPDVVVPPEIDQPPGPDVPEVEPDRREGTLPQRRQRPRVTH
jgi:hypothetical protein